MGTPDMLEFALRYARHGCHVIPLNTPLFDAAGNVVGCTCEEYRRSSRCKSEHPHLYLGPQGNCHSPGKCPRVRWRDKSTADENQIRHWWQEWPDAGIGIDCGKSGLLVLDIDEYKDTYVGLGKLDLNKNTVTVLTGGGGKHRWYRQSEGEQYGNHTGALPAGIDIRGQGGYVVAPPSLHQSGRRYEFEPGCGLGEIDLAALPQALQDILDKAQHTNPVQTVQFGQEVAERPDLAQWQLSWPILDLIDNPRPKGYRSEADASVCTALVNAGASDDDILAVFQHYPVGVDGKYGACGDDYLTTTISSARAFTAEHPRPDPEQFRKQLADWRRWVKTTSFRDLVPSELRSATGYRTDSTDTKLADALLDVAEERGAFQFRVSYEELRRRAGLGSKSTVRKGIGRLSGWFVEVVESGDAIRSTSFRIVADVACRSNTIISSTVIAFDLHATYSGCKADDAFLLGCSRTAKRGRLSERGLGETILRVIAALEPDRAMTRRMLVSLTGKSESAIATATRRAAKLGLLECRQAHAYAPKIYELAPDHWARITMLAQGMKTHMLGVEREDRAKEDIQRRCERALRLHRYGELKIDEGRLQLLEHRREWAISRRYQLVPIIHPDWTEDEVSSWILEPEPINKRDPACEARINGARMEGRIQYQRECAAQRQRVRGELRSQKVPRSRWDRMLTLAGYTPSDITMITHKKRRG